MHKTLCDRYNNLSLSRLFVYVFVFVFAFACALSADHKRATEANQKVVVRNSQGVCEIFAAFGVPQPFK